MIETRGALGCLSCGDAERERDDKCERDGERDGERDCERDGERDGKRDGELVSEREREREGDGEQGGVRDRALGRWSVTQESDSFFFLRFRGPYQNMSFNAATESCSCF